MDDARVWTFEESLWTADPDHYRESIDGECLMVLPAPPYIMSGEASIEAVIHTPRWVRAAFSEQRIARPQEGLIVIAYKVHAERDGIAPYEAHCTSTYRRLAHDEWRVVQHQQTALVPPQPPSGG